MVWVLSYRQLNNYLSSMSSRTKLLIIEPDIVFGNNLVSFLNHQDFDCRLVTTAQKGIEAIDNFKPDMIILEIQLSVHSGIEFLYELRSYDDIKKCPVIVYTMLEKSVWGLGFVNLKLQLKVDQYLCKLDNDFFDLIDEIKKYFNNNLSHAIS